MFGSSFNSKTKKKSSQISYWLSISDLMASILIIFILFFILKVNTESRVKRIYKILFQQQELIVDELKDRFEDDDNVKVLDDGTIYFYLSDKGQMDTWFAMGSGQLSTNAREYLKEFVPEYLDVLLNRTYYGGVQLEKIIVEGHTDSTRHQGSKTELDNYLYNLQLSQVRAFNVSKFIQEEIDLEKDVRKILQGKLTANGRSYAIPFMVGALPVDSLSRRVEFKFKLDWEKAFKEI